MTLGSFGGLAFWAASPALAQATAAPAGGTFLHTITERLEHTLRHGPALAEHLALLPGLLGGRALLLLAVLVAAGLLAEAVFRAVLQRLVLRRGGTDGAESFRTVAVAALIDLGALVALWLAGRAVLAELGDPQSMAGQLGRQVLMGLVHWRAFGLLFRIWLRPAVPGARFAPVDDAMARRLLLGLNLMILLPLTADRLEQALLTTGAGAHATAVAILFWGTAVSLALLAIVWTRRHDMAAWLAAMVSEGALARKLKLDAARNWWILALAFYAATGLAELWGELAGSDTAADGMDTIETALIALLLFETAMYRFTRHIRTELPMAGDVVSDCLRLAVRLYIVIVIAGALMVRVLGAETPEAWAVHDRGAKMAALTAVVIYAFWRFLRFRMDSYIAANPLPSADVSGTAEDEVRVAASRLRTLMPLLRVVSGVTIAIFGTLLVLSELGVNITPLIAGASVLGLAVSFGSQSLVRDVVSGVFFLAEDSFRIGEYVDCSKVKGVVEGFSVRCLKLRHQNGQLHIVPFGQVGHITNFSRDWTVIKFNLAFAPGTDVELLRRTVKKIGLDLMEDPTLKPILIQPLKMQGVVDIKDSQLIVRFKFMAKPKNPSQVQRLAIRRMYDAFPALGIRFAQPVFPFAMPGAAMPGAPVPAPPAVPAPPPAAEVKAAE
ncbi:mechanosensitive ion channel domain-containing protein [Reyranella sp.]|uniref:mechanosensitive ion channel domain-containing protein n=1 Tax=Reyranella sp. TaxID=1929291 RepID=UPI003BA88061